MSDEPWRIFIGLLLHQRTRSALTSAQRQLQAQPLAVRWVRPKNLHITLHFLGDVNPSAVPQIEQTLDAELRGLSAPTFAFDMLGAFPKVKTPVIVWAGMTQEQPALQQLHRAAELAGLAVGVQPEQRPYTPHATLGYVKRDATSQQRQQIATAIQQPWAGAAQRTEHAVAIIHSQLTRQGPIYTPLHTWQLDAEE